jgi:glycosyltransferase involved in cell wall biosynthesis
VKVLFLNPIGTLGGAEQALLDLIASLRYASPTLQMEVLALEDGPLLSEAAALGASTDVLPLPGVLATLGESGMERDIGRAWVRKARAGAALSTWLPRFVDRLRRKRADVLHSNGLKTHFLAALAKPRGAPLIWHLHDFISERRFSARLLPRLEGRAALGVAVSQAVADDARTVLRRQRIVTVLNGIRGELFAPGRVRPLDLDALAGLGPAPEGVVRVGLVATYASWKGHKLFLEAVRRVTDSEDARFYVIGGPVYSTAGSQVTEAELREAISRFQLDERCGLVGFRSDVARVYAALDIVVQASTRREPFGRTVAEAMAAGRVVVAPAAGGILEQIEDGETGLLFQAGNADALTSVLARAISAPGLRASIAQNALSAAHEALDHRRLGPRLASLYDELTAAA